MKKIAFALSLISTICLISCDPWEDDSYHETVQTGENVEIPGNWKLTSILLEEAFDFNGDGNATNNLMTETNCYANELMAFNADFSGVATSNSYANVIVNGDTYITECVPEVEETPFAWAQTQTTVSLTIDTQIVNATLSGDTLTFTIPEGFSANDGQPGGYTITQDIIMTYQKLP
ncbi:hypothetical protein [Moheibacter lacus]|uniref:Lipocalin-like domain-containing protein n=1 Tax=Moheibacter lacus TaxID=2745851 RepID=A0A838ZHT9_9FLAO|nr:hypothetical protein [Moheibacter lacus]MBA5628818.1 hypothetical protein [Moheibacter lacus]